jgi:hypothetical protein
MAMVSTESAPGPTWVRSGHPSNGSNVTFRELIQRLLTSALWSNRQMIVRDEEADDRESVYQVVSSAFGQADEANLVRDLESAGDTVISLVAIQDACVVGHILLSKMTAPFRALARYRCRLKSNGEGSAHSLSDGDRSGPRCQAAT